MKKAKTLIIRGKVSDSFQMYILDGNRTHIDEYFGYVPDLFCDDDGDVDYIDFEVDIATGKILGWVAPTPKDLQNIVDEKEL